MIVGLPAKGDYPADPHSALWHNHQIQTFGGLVDGPVYSSIFKSLLGVHLTKDDMYAPFQTDLAVYHDDYADYSTNEPTMDGTASLTYILSARQKEGASTSNKHVYTQGGIIRTNPEQKHITLVFSGHEYADGYETILPILTKHGISASFFFTGDFYRNPAYNQLIQDLKEKGHYLGAHSDQHLLYCPWEKRDSLLVDKTTVLKDLKANYAEMSKFGINPTDAPYYLPPFEWYNDSISSWCNDMGIQIVNYTPGTYSNADYTIPSMNNYLSSKEIYKRIMGKEKREGLNGNILLFHIGTSPQRKDKFYPLLDKLIIELKKKNYTFTNINKAIN
jgi:peptidoglycan/xylan/chitin deacetylase (PgdA/CDA1 family)